MQFRVAFEHHSKTPYFIYSPQNINVYFTICQSVVKVTVDSRKARHFSCVEIFRDTFWYCVPYLAYFLSESVLRRL